MAIVADGAERTEEGSATVEQTRAAFERIDAAITQVRRSRSPTSPTPPRVVAAGADGLNGELDEVAGVAERSTAASQQVSASTEQTTAVHARDRRLGRSACRTRRASSTT